MRVGANPNHGKQLSGFLPIVCLVVTNLPTLSHPYHAKRLEVVQTCLNSMRQGAEVEHTFMVWDNDSCRELKNWLQYDFKPDVLVQTDNVGKTYAQTAAVGMLPPGSIVAYSDDDMYFYPGWLQPQLDLLENFPGVSVVTGYPVRTAFRWGCDNTRNWARAHAKLEAGDFIPQAWEDDFAVSIGRDITWHRQYTENDIDWLITYNGKSAYATAHHCQFVAYVETLKKYPRWSREAMQEEKSFDIAMDRLGLRLATIGRHCRHIGNVLHDELKQEIQAARTG
jgi:hypothetical protein